MQNKKILVNCGCGSKYHSEWHNLDFVSNSKNVKEHNLLKELPFDNDTVDFIYCSHFLEHLSVIQAKKFLINCSGKLKKDAIIRIVIPDLENIVKEYLEILQNLKSKENSKSEMSKYECIVLELIDQMVRTESGGLLGKYLLNNNLNQYTISRFGYIKSTNNKRMIINEESNKVIKFFRNNIFIRRYLIGKFHESGEKHQWMYDEYSIKCLLEKCGYSNIMFFRYNESQLQNFKKYKLEINTKGKEYKVNSLYVEATK